MKILIITALFLFATLYSFAQNSFVNTRWKPLAENSPLQEMSFKRDTLIVTPTSSDILVWSFAQHHDSLMIKKISGRGTCPETVEGWYRVEWINNGDKVLFRLINDECDRRASAMIAYTLERIRN
jgi:hypothetical protein